jgi:sulfur-oxidizing protein SoxX
MHKIITLVLGLSVSLFLGMLMAIPAASAAGEAPDPSICENKANPPKDVITQGGCIVIERKKGNCNACHAIAGVSSGNVAPPLVSMSQRFPDKNKLRDQISDATKVNPNTIMPPFGRHQILSKDEIDKVVEFILSL